MQDGKCFSHDQISCWSFWWVILWRWPSNFNIFLEHRAAIRESWASVAQNETLIVFLLGRPAGTQESNADETMVQIISEAEKYSDILLGDYTDTYANLTVKECWKKRIEHPNKPQLVLIP